MSARSKTLKTARVACRIPIFAPTRRPTAVMQQRVETSWGWAMITGRLGQHHRDVLDTLIAHASGWRPEGTRGDMVARIDSAALRRALGWNRWTYERIRETLRDLRAAEVAASCGEWTGILTHIVESAVAPPSRRNGGGVGKGGLAPVPGGPARDGMVWEITVSGAWITLAKDVARYPMAVTKMRYGTSQAVSRLMLSHTPGTRYAVQTALEAVGVPKKRHIRARAEMEVDRAGMAAVGIVLDPILGTVAHVDHTSPVAPEKQRALDHTSPVAPEKQRALDHTSPVADHTSPVADHTSPVKTTQARSL